MRRAPRRLSQRELCRDTLSLEATFSWSCGGGGGGGEREGGGEGERGGRRGERGWEGGRGE